MLDTAYVSRVFSLGAADAIDATEAWYRELEFAPGGRRLIGGRKLLLRPCFAPTAFDPQLLRRFRGTLWVGWWWPVRIELELVRYSCFESEIALHPATLRWPAGTERYAHDAATTVEGIVATITRGELMVRAGESAAKSTDNVARALFPRPDGFADRFAGRPRFSDPSSHRHGKFPSGHLGVFSVKCRTKRANRRLRWPRLLTY
jgi:hypothetical protein